VEGTPKVWKEAKEFSEVYMKSGKLDRRKYILLQTNRRKQQDEKRRNTAASNIFMKKRGEVRRKVRNGYFSHQKEKNLRDQFDRTRKSSGSEKREQKRGQTSRI